MNANQEMLNYVYQNAQMGVETIKQLLQIAEKEAFLKCLERQLTEYKEIEKKAKAILNESGCDEKGISQMEKITSYLMINMKTMTDQSASHIADMMIKGSSMGIVEATKKIHQYEQEADKEIVALMKKLLKTEENNVEELKKFL